MQDSIRYNVLKRRLEYVKMGNREIIKACAGKEYSSKIIAACRRFSNNYAKPVLVLKADGSVVIKETEDRLPHTAMDVA